MKILFLTDNFPPEANAPASRTFEHCREWVKKGMEVTVITCAPNFPKGKVFEGYRNKFIQKEFIDGIKVIRVWSFIAPNSGFLKRILDFISYAFMAFWVGLFQKTDIIIGTSPQFFTVVAARWLSFFKRRPWIMEVRDLWPESIAAVGIMKKDSRVYKLLEKVERSLYRSANKIVPVTYSFKEYILEYIQHKDKVKVITNGIDPELFQPIPKDVELTDKYSLQNSFVVGYIGTHGMAHALDFILDCAKAVADNEVTFILLGDGAEKSKLMRKAKDEHIQNVLFLPFVIKTEVNRYISILDVALVNLKKSDTFKSVIPSKIFENACMEKPILLGVEGESKNIIEKYNAGVAYIPENKSDFINALNRIRDPKNYSQYKQGCRRLAKEFERSKLADEMLSFIKS